MRRKLLYASVCALIAGAGYLGFDRAGPRAPDVAGSSQAVRAPDSTPPSAPRVAELAASSSLDDGLDHVTEAPAAPGSGERFPATPIGRALDRHLLILVDINPGADDRKARSLAELRRHPKEASQALVDAYHAADPADAFGRWLISLTLRELGSEDAYAGLQEIATAEIPASLKDSDRDGNARSNESAIHQNGAAGLAELARAGNAAAEHELLALALRPPSGDDAVRTVAIKGYLSAGRDYDARVQTLKAQLPSQYHDVVTLTISEPEPASPPQLSTRNAHKNGG